MRFIQPSVPAEPLAGFPVLPLGRRRRPTRTAAPIPMFLCLIVLSVLVAAPALLHAPAGVGVQLEPVLTTGLASPLSVTHARDGSGRLFIVEQGGVIKVLQRGGFPPTEFLNITAKVLSGGEGGLLGLAFHPQYPTNGRFFVNYT